MASKSRSNLSETPNKASLATPRVSKISRGVSKSESESPSPLQNVRHSVERTPRSVNSKLTPERKSPRPPSTPPEKQPQRAAKGSELQNQLNLAQEDLKKAKEQLIQAEKEKVKAIDELKEAQRVAEEANERLREALVAQKRAEEDSEIEKFRAVELEQAGIESVKKKEEEWQKELESVRNQHSLDVASLLSTTQELQRVKQELAMTCDAKNQAMNHADDATKIAEIHAEKAEILSAELTRLKALLDSKLETEAGESKAIEVLTHELEKAKGYEEKLMAQETSIQELHVELEAAKTSMEQLNMELTMTRDAKNQALKHADDATKIAEIHAEKAEVLSAELTRLKALIDSKLEKEASDNNIILNLKTEIDTLTQELEKAKVGYEEKLTAKETCMQELHVELDAAKDSIEQLNVELEAAKMAECYAHSLLEEWNKKVEELEMKVEEANRSERSTSESLEYVMKQLEINNALLHEAESEVVTLREKVSLLETTIRRQRTDLEDSEHQLLMAKEESLEMSKKVDSLNSELETMKEAKAQALSNEKLAAARVQTLLDEKSKLINELETSRDEEEKSKTAMESLASALHEVSTEAREVKEKLLIIQAEHESYENQIEDLKSILKVTNEKYESMLNDARHEIDVLTCSIENSKNDFENSKAEWQQRELHLKKTEEENASLGKEINRLATLLKETEQEARAAKEEEAQLKENLKEVEAETIHLQEALKEATAESMKLKESLLDKENEMQSIIQENDEIRTREAESIKKVEELSKLLEEATATTTRNHAEENVDLIDSEKDYDLLPNVVEFSEENGHVGGEDKEETILLNDKHENVNGEQLKEGEKRLEKEDDSVEGEFKMWESCKIEKKEFSPEREQEPESFEDEVDSKTEGGESFDKINGMSSSAENIDDGGGSSPSKQQHSKKKKKALLGKFGSLLKKKAAASNNNNHK